MQHPARTVACRFEHGTAQVQPLLRRMRPEAAGHGPQSGGRLLRRVKAKRLTQIRANAAQGGNFNRRADVVDRQAAHLRAHRCRRRAHAHADQPTHAGAHPINLRQLQLRQHRQHGRGVHRHLVMLRLGQPVAAPAPGHIGTQHAQRVRRARHQSLRQHIEVTALSGQAVGADHRMRRVRCTPFPVGHAVAAARLGADRVAHGALHEMQAGLSHGLDPLCAGCAHGR